MKQNAIGELKHKPLSELQQLLEKKREELRVLRFDLAAGKVKNVSQIRNAKKDIARLLTFINTSSKQDN